jgi:putative nucleotidyltransferase with HDIG domain
MDGNMKRVLFVDHQPRVLEGLKRMLRPLREEWTMDFARGGRAALRQLAEYRYDVLVTDVSMPDIDATELLSETIRISPQTVRIVLCGGRDIEATLRSASLAHQYLAKPCDVATIQATVEKALSLQTILDDAALAELIGRVQSLPSPPAIYFQLMDAVRCDNISAADLGAIIAQDLGMTAKVLQFANSPLFAPARAIASPEQAVVYLGVDMVRALAITESVFSQFGRRNHPGFSPEELQDHSYQVAAMARKIARERRIAPQFVADIFLGGLMHDIGKLLLGSNFPAEYREVVRCFGDPEALRETESRLFGTTHAEVGAYLLWLWGVPASVAGIVAQHHLADSDSAATNPAAIVQLADRMVREGESPSGGEYLARIGLPVSAVR